MQSPRQKCVRVAKGLVQVYSCKQYMFIICVHCGVDATAGLPENKVLYN